MRAMTVVLATALGASCLAGCSSGKNDEALATDIKAQMFSDPRVKSANVEVAVKDGEATLSGDVPDATARDRAFRLASDTPGVKHVVDKMAVQSVVLAPPAPPIPAPDPASEPAPAPEPARRAPRHRNRHAEDSAQRDYSSPAPLVVAPSQAAQAPDPNPAPPVDAPPQPVAEAAPPPPPPPPQPKHAEIPSGTSVRVQMIDGIDSAVNKAGETFHASLATPIVIDNEVAVPAGTDIWVKLVNAQASGQFGGQSHLELQLVRMEYQGQSYALVSNNYQQSGTNRTTRSAETIGGGAVLGAVLGGLIGHGKGAAIGAATGAGAGTVAQAATKPNQIQIPSETKLDFSLQQPVEVNYFPEKNRSPQH